MSTYHIGPDKTIQKIVRATFPSYHGRKFKISTDIPSQLRSYWDGGSRDHYSFYQLSTGKCVDLPSNHPMFEPNNPSELKELPPGMVIVKHSYFCGKDMGITIYANGCDITPLLPPKVELTDHERIVLRFTRGYKPSYAGIKNYRFHKASRETKITQDEWETAKSSLIMKKLLNKRGAITIDGRNALEQR
jgi:hypothetical protein